jgi:O-antigen ligase
MGSEARESPRWRRLNSMRGGDTRLSAARFALWLGAFLPIIYQVGRSVDEVGGIGPLEVLRGIGPAVAFIISFMFAPTGVRRLKRGLPEVAITSFLLFAVGSTLWSISPSVTLLKCVPLFFAYLCCMRLPSFYSSGRDVIRGVVTTAHVVLIGALIQFVLLPSQTYSGSIDDPVARFHTSIPAISSNLLGLVVAIGLAGILLKVGPSWTIRAPWSILLVLFYVGILIAGRSRIVTVAAVVVAVAALFVAMHRSTLTAILGWFVITFVLCLFGWAVQSKEVTEALSVFALRGQDAHGIGTLTGRTTIWDLAMIAWRQEPIVGYGYYAGHRLELSRMFALFQGYSNVDNTWIETLVDLGVIGTFALASYAFFGLVRTLLHRWGGHEGWIAIGVVVSGIALSFINPGIQSTSSTLVFFAVVVFASRRTIGPMDFASRNNFLLRRGKIRQTAVAPESITQ